MSDKNNLSFHEGEEEEFHITDEDIDRELAAMEGDTSVQSTGDVSAEAESEKPPTKSRFAGLKQLKRKHWMIIIIVVLILLFSVLKFIAGNQSQASFDQITPVSATSNSPVLNTKKPERDLTKAVLEPKMPETASSAPLTAPTLSAPASGTTKTDFTAPVRVDNKDAQLAQVLEVIQQQNQMLTQQLSALSSRVVGLESTLSQSNQAVAGLSQQMGALKNEEMPAAPLPKLTQTVVTGPQYTVEAVVPQRAWLQTSDGSTITVMVGDDLPGLGAVVSIDPYSGNVTTASGTVIKYGS